ncbi:hypothetical protein LINPERHAP1_LOCUS40992 [Linum perenne]
MRQERVDGFLRIHGFSGNIPDGGSRLRQTGDVTSRNDFEADDMSAGRLRRQLILFQRENGIRIRSIVAIRFGISAASNIQGLENAMLLSAYGLKHGFFAEPVVKAQGNFLGAFLEYDEHIYGEAGG